jgi:riboflavin kinase/FMN adenylyltransferase
MQIYHDLSRLISEQPTVLTIGMFDGVHLGHQRLIRAVVESARASGRHAALVTFFPHPGVVMGRAEPFYLTSTEEKLAQLERLGLDLVIVVEFTPETARIRADQFVNLLIENVNMREMWTGHDFALGYRREGNTAFLRALGALRGFSVHTIVEPVLLDGHPVSSSRIRAALRAGDMRQASACLGRQFQVSGSVLPSVRRRRNPAVRAATLTVASDHALPCEGNYVCRARVSGATCDATADITRSAHNDRGHIIELSLLDFDGDLYGQTLTLDLIERQLSEGRNEEIEALITQQRQRPADQLERLLAYTLAPASQNIHPVVLEQETGAGTRFLPQTISAISLLVAGVVSRVPPRFALCSVPCGGTSMRRRTVRRARCRSTAPSRCH